jgi:hypothetical protein
MFYDAEDPKQFVRDACSALADDGVFIAQLMTLAPMLKQKDLGNICHEHLEYYTYDSLVYLFEECGLEIYKVEENKINGGSLRLYARKKMRGSIMFQEEKPDLQKFFKRVNKELVRTREFIDEAVSMGKKVYGLGASTKGNTYLQYMGLNPAQITGIADPNIRKLGKFTVGTHIRIVSEEEARADAGFFFVLPYAFLKSFMEKEKAWHDKGGRFITCTPTFKVI